MKAIPCSIASTPFEFGLILCLEFLGKEGGFGRLELPAHFNSLSKQQLIASKNIMVCLCPHDDVIDIYGQALM